MNRHEIVVLKTKSHGRVTVTSFDTRDVASVLGGGLPHCKAATRPLVKFSERFLVFSCLQFFFIFDLLSIAFETFVSLYN